MSEKRNIFQRTWDAVRGEERGIVVMPSSNYSLLQPLSATGLNPGKDTLQLPTMYAAVSKVADTIASLDATVVKIDKEGTPSEQRNHPVAVAINKRPNPLMTAYEFWQHIVSDAMLYGIGHAHALESGELYHIPHGHVNWTMDPATGMKWYSYEGAPSPIPQTNWIEIRAFRSLDPTIYQQQTLTLQKNFKDFATKYVQEGGRPAGVLSPKVGHVKNQEDIDNLSRQWQTTYAGLQNAHRVAVMNGQWEFTPISGNFSDVDMSSQMKQLDKEIARMFNIPPSMLGLESNTAYSNYEQEVLQFYQGCILPWVKRIEQELESKMFKRNNLEVRFNVDTLLRADLSARANYYSTALQHGWMSTNEVRAKEGLGAVEGGDVITKQVNQLPLHYLEAYAESITNGEDVQQLPADSEEQSEGGAEAQGED